MINLSKARNEVKVAYELRKILMKIDFRLDDKFCDKDELKSSWLDTKIPDDSVFFCRLIQREI